MLHISIGYLQFQYYYALPYTMISKILVFLFLFKFRRVKFWKQNALLLFKTLKKKEMFYYDFGTIDLLHNLIMRNENTLHFRQNFLYMKEFYGASELD